MADERDDTEHTEDPTPKRLEEAIKRGDVVKSVEVNTWFMIAGGTLMLMVFAAPMATSLQATFRGLLAHSYEIPTDGPALAMLTKAAGDRRSSARSAFRFCSSALPHWPATSSSTAWCSRSSRSSRSCREFRRPPGSTRLFSRQALANFAKGLAKLALIGTVIDGAAVAAALPSRAASSPPIRRRSCRSRRSLAMQMLGTVVAILAIVAAADYLFQYRQWFERQKMSLREMKEEFRQTEGDPADQGQAAAVAPDAHAQAHDGGGAEGLGRHHQPDAFRRRAAIRARHECAGLRRQGRRPDRPQDPRGGRAARRFRWSRTRRWPARCTARSRSTRKSRRNITARSPKSSATSCGCAARWAAAP